ncbi:MAG: hypothetical protein Alpg2KO_32830 [Alphaproteobacteria bacterium]
MSPKDRLLQAQKMHARLYFPPHFMQSKSKDGPQVFRPQNKAALKEAEERR